MFTFKQTLLLTIFLLCFLFQVQATEDELDPEYEAWGIRVEEYEFEEDAIAFFSQIIQEKEYLGLRVLANAMKKSWYNLAQIVIEDFFLNKTIDVMPVLIEARNGVTKDKLKDYEQVVQLAYPWNSGSLQKVPPCYQWAQNMTHLHLRVKFTPRWDTPADSQYQNLQISFDSNYFKVEALGLTTAVPIKYNLTIDSLYQGLDTRQCQWSFDSQGMIYIEMRKVPAPYFWENMYLDVFYEPPNQYFWFDMQARFKEAVGTTISLLEEKDLARDDLEEDAEYQEDIQIENVRTMKHRLVKYEKYLWQDKKDKKYCWDLHYEPKCLVANPFDWHAWF